MKILNCFEEMAKYFHSIFAFSSSFHDTFAEEPGQAGGKKLRRYKKYHWGGETAAAVAADSIEPLTKICIIDIFDIIDGSARLLTLFKLLLQYFITQKQIFKCFEAQKFQFSRRIWGSKI